MPEITTDAPSEGLKHPLTGIPFAETVDLDEYVPGDDVDDDALVIAELIAFRDLKTPDYSASVIHMAARANYREDAGLMADMRSLEPKQFAALGAELLALGLIERDAIVEPDEADAENDDDENTETRA
jgi:hypothetical protein